MELRLSEHAKSESVRRDIPADLLLEVAKEPQQIVAARNGLECRQSKFLDDFSKKEYLLRVVINTKAIPYVIVTVYKTSKIKKYWSTIDES